MTQKIILSAQKLAGLAPAAISLLNEAGHVSLGGDMAAALKEFEAADAGAALVDKDMLERIRRAYPADMYGNPYTDDELGIFVWAAWRNGWSPDPQDGDCYPIRGRSGEMGAGDAYRMLTREVDAMARDRGWVKYPIAHERVSPDERNYLGVKNENDQVARARLKFRDNTGFIQWSAAYERMMDSLGGRGQKFAPAEAKEILDKINAALGPAPACEWIEYEAIGIFREEEREDDPVIKRFKHSPWRRACDRAEKAVCRKALPLGGARMIIRKDIADETKEVIEEREKELRGETTPQEKKDEFIAEQAKRVFTNAQYLRGTHIETDDDLI